MKYEIGWVPKAQEQFAALWLESQDRNEFSAHIDRVERELRLRGDTLGESRQGDDRIYFAPPIVVLYRVSELFMKVLVFSVGWSGKPK